MGLKEYLKAGTVFQRTDVTTLTDEQGSGSINLGSAYILLNVTTDYPCRLRLYDTAASLEDVAESTRAFGDSNISATTALIADMSMSVAGTYTIDPVVYGVVENPLNKLTYYRISETQSLNYPTITLTRYNIEDSNISTQNRVNLATIQAELAPLAKDYGTIVSTTLPKTYLLVSASLSGVNNTARLRLYATDTALSDATELNRPFSVEPAAGTTLIVDMIVSSSETTYFTPKIVGTNLQTMGNNLIPIQQSQINLAGINNVYYILENPSTTDTRQLSMSVHVFELER